MTQLLVNDSLLEIDHIFVCIESAVDQSLFEDIGLICSKHSTYNPQQGTASRIIFFENTYIELIWVEDETAAEIYAMRSGIDFLARSCHQQNNTSPFGIALHQKPNVINSPWRSSTKTDEPEPFLNFAAANLVAQSEPLCFIIPESIALSNISRQNLGAYEQLISHPLGLKKLTKTVLGLQQLDNLSAPVFMLLKDEIIRIKKNSLPVLDLTFDYGSRGETLDLRPFSIPIVLRY